MDEHKIEESIRLLVKRFPNARKLIKPTILHSLRVGMFLYERKYRKEVVIGALLHDVLEDTNITPSEIKKLFGNYVLDLVQANTQNNELSKDEKKPDLIGRCAAHSQDALLIKCSDILDNYSWWSRQSVDSEINRCKFLAQLVKDHQKPEYQDPLFDVLYSTVLN